ncbi:response regulator [Teredinibacter waterburyi]|jgi:response regulator receiver modulated diguanylate cyclase|uniref:response regulator n=1 Tax=Teredinibacter waterburyi TaxID=1500538 RepID=UPI00165EE084|nr:response regulator [Teredinibacter waterburyi]
MKKVLVVEDSVMVMKVLTHVLSRSDQVLPVYAKSFSEAKARVESGEHEFFAALVDLSLPDAPDGEVVDYTLGLDIPTIVLTGSFDEKRRADLLNKGIVDYVTKEGRYSYQYALGVLHRLIKNQRVKVLVVDDSSTARKFVSQMLRLHLYPVFEAEDGVEAIKVLLANPDIKILITDYHMPRMDGFELVKNIRVKYEKSDLIIVGLSSEGDGTLSAKFIKHGANDFLRKPFNHEEFHCRITHNVEYLEMIEKLRDAVNRDDLTGCYSRKYFFQHGGELYRNAVAANVPISLAILNLDDFRKINERYGNDVGNDIICQVATNLRRVFGRFLVARADGEEFYALLSGLPNDKACAFVDRARQVVSADSHSIDSTGDAAFAGVSLSAGVTSVTGESLDLMIARAGDCLQRAKDVGGDMTMGDD